MKNINFKVMVCSLCVCTILAACETKDQPTHSNGFSVSPTLKVCFAPGNLQYRASTNTWRFAENQYDYIGNENSNISSTNNGWIDLFGFGTGHTPTKNSSNSEDYEFFTDWGTNEIIDFPKNLWRTLSNSEWRYLLYTRPNAQSLCAAATIDTIAGLIILPDNWKLPNNINFEQSYDCVNFGNETEYVLDEGVSYFINKYTKQEWNTLEMAGAVFIPACGWRFGKEVIYLDGSFNIVEWGGGYWSSTPNPDSNFYAYCLRFDGHSLETDNTARYCGCAVRLVREQ